MSRPTLAREVAGGLYEVLPTVDYDPADEEWELPPGARVRIEKRKAKDGDYFIAVNP